MAERPLYTLYKNLKAQNYDVPDDYDKFESALTRDGKGGADNRHAIYENLKAQNFDVPNTYERFYSALFEPRSKTSSRAKGGSVPMSAADRARFSARTAAILSSAQHTMNNAGRYNKLKQRKQRQQKDFGRVNLGTHQTPYGGDANNVVKDDFAYNPETGKAGSYVSSDNENVYSQPEAEQKQAVLDQQNNAYQEAVDTGEIPSVFDVRDKNGNYDLQENIGKNGTYLTEEGARNQFDKKLADAYARKKEIEALIAEDHRQHGNPLLSYGASIGASNGRTAEQSDYSNKLATSLALVKQQIGALEAVKQYPTSSWGEDALKALDNTVFTAKTWDFGLTDFATMGQMERIKTKMDNNLPLSGSDKMFLKSKLGADAAAALEDEKMGNIYRWTKIAGQSLPFMADFFLTGGYGGITKTISRGALKFAAKRGMGKVSAAILKNTGIVAGDVIGSYAMAGSEQAMKTGADIMQRHLGSLYQDEKGDYKFGTFDENGNLLHEGGESMGTALYKGLTSAMVENYTEKLFGHSYGIKKGAINFMEKHGMNASAEFFNNIGKSGWYTNSKKWMEKFGINGFGEEVMEEEIGIPLHALLDGDNKFSDLLDAKQQLDIIGGMALSVGSMYAMGAGSRPVKGVYNRAQYYRFRNKVNVADIDAQNLMGDNWADIKDKIDNATNEQMGSVLADILRQRDTMSKDQINAAINYGVNLMKMRGYNVAKTAEMNAREITNEPTTPEEQHQEDIDNAYSEGHDADDADKHDIQLEHEDQMKTLAGLLNISEQQLSAMNDDELQSLTGQNDKLDQAIYDYQLSSARYQGVTDDAQDKIDMAANQAAQRVDMYTDKSRGSVRNATVKASGGAEDYGVYIISGNIATNEDGSINVADSDDMILFYDPTTNSVEHADALRFAELGDEVPADDVKAQAVADAKEKAIKEVAGIVDGTIDVGSQFNVTDTDGTEHIYEVLADYGDGTAAISIDGNVVENPYSLADLQQMKDLEDQKRLEAAKAQREQMEKERAAQQTEQSQETEQPEETQPSLDFNQILNDNGNVVLVDVLDKDGNTKYPDSKLFLIRDTGAKAKVVEMKSDGTFVPHAVSKKDVATISSMSLDEYKQAMAETSMIEENSGAIEGDRGGIEVNDELPPVPDNVTINGDGTYSVDGAVQGGENTTAPSEQTEQTPAMTLEDGTIVPMLEDGNPDFSKLTADQTAELYDSQFGEDADSVISGWVSDAKKALDKANNMTVNGKNFVEQKAAKEAKEKAIADTQAAYDSAIAIRDAYNSRQLAKIEDDADGRKNLIEKARRKFARLKSAVKDDAEAVSQLYKDVVGSLLHRLYDSTGIDVTDTIPLTAEEYVASNLGAHSLNYEGTETSKGVKQETGLSREDFAKTQLLAADGKGTTIDDLVHSLWENRPSNLESLDTQDIRNALIGVLNSGFRASEARNYIENLRIAQAENILEEQKKAADNAAFTEEQKTKQEEEKKKAELERKAEEEKKKADEEKTNEDRNAPELSIEQQKAKKEGEKLGLPAVDKEGEPINQYVIELANWAKEQGLEIDPTSKLNSYADLFLMCKDGFGVITLVPDEGENINQVVYFPDNVKDFDQLWKLQEEFNAGRDLKLSSNIDSELTEGAIFYDGDTAREFKEFVDKKVEKQNKVFGEQRPEEDLPFSAKENGKQQTTAERAADVEKNKVDDMKVVDNIVGQKTRKAFERLAKMMGANIQWQYSDKLGNGWIQETTDSDGNVHRTIFITLDSSITEGAQFIFGHEMTHQIKHLNPAAYNELTQLVLDTYGSDAFDKAIDETMKRYSDAGFSGRARDYYAEEVVADAVGEMIRDLNLAHTLAMKMSHPLLAAIHEILQKIKLAFYGTEYSDVTKNIIRSIEQAYVKTANGQVTNTETGEDVSFSLRQKPEPKKKGIGYKVFVLKDGKLYPPMVANPDGAATPVGVWLDADAAPIAGESKTGRPQVKQGGKGTQGGSGKLAYRPGWHLGVVPYAIQFNRKDAEGNKTLFPKNFVFAEVEYAADVDYQDEARQEGINPSGKYQHSLAGLKHLPTDGYYMYRTNPNPETDPWVITGAMKVNRILTRAEQAELVKNAGRDPQQIQEGDIVTDDVVNSINQEIAAAPKFSLKVYHGSGADFTEFDFDHMGEGAGSQAFGWGGYVTSSKKIGKSYATMMDNDPSKAYYRIQRSNGTRFAKKYPTLESFLHGDKRIAMNDKFTEQEKIDFYNEMKKLAEPYHNLYEVDIPEDNGSNYLDWDAPITDELIDKVAKALPSLRSFDIKDLKKDRTFDNFYKTISMRSVKDDASFNDDKAASKLLASLGYTGIKYKAGRNFGGAEEGDTNYVIFKPEDMRITEHTKFSLKSKPVRFEAGKKLSDEEKKEVLSTLKDAYKVNGVPYHIEETAGSKEKRVYEPTADSYVVSDITNRPLRYYITLPDGRVAHPTEVYPNISDNEVKSSATKQGLLDEEVDQIVSAAIGNMKDIADNAKAVEILNELQNLPHETHDVGYGLNHARSYNYKTGIFTSDAAQAIDYVVRRMRRKEDVPAEIPAALKKAVADSYGMVDNLIDGMSNTKVGAVEIKPVGVGAFGNIYNQFRGNAKAAIEFLKKVRGGEAVGALHHKDIGDIDLVWGKEGTGHSDGYGLSKLVKYHPEVLDNLQEILNDMRVVSSSKNRVNLESETHKAGVRLTWDGERKSWLLTAFKKETSASDKRTDTAATSLEGDTALSQTEGSAAKIDNSSETAKENGEKVDSEGTKFSLKDEKTMFGMHNISIDKLRKAIKQGGFAAPSMGVVDSKNGIYSDYGEITLIPKAEKLAKRTGKNAGTFTADAWTPTYPQVERIMNKQGEKAFNTDMNEKLGDVDNGIYSNIRESWKGYLSSGDVRDGLYWHYLFDKGMNPETIYHTGKYDNDITNEVMRISDNGYKTDYTDEEVAELIQLMNKATGKDNDVDAQREKLKTRIASAEKQGNHLLVALKKKRLAELEGIENFFIAADFVNDVVRNNRKNGKVDVHDTMGAAKKKVEDNKKLSTDFPSWLDKKTEEYGVEEMLYNGTTPSGKPKYIPNTIDNAVKLMKKQGVAGGYTAFGSELGVFIAKNSPEVNTLAAMKNAKDKLIPFGDERHNQIKDKITKEFLELSDEIRVGSNNRYAFDDSGVSRMVELTDHKGNEKEYLKKAYNVEVSDEWMDRYNKLLDTIKKDYKVFYFETKFMRPYGLDEFEKAIVPNDTPSDVVDALKKAGIDVSSYERGNAEDRQKVTMDAINSSDNIKFSLKAEKEKIVTDAKANGTYMTAPNGEKTKLDAEQWAIVRTANFKNWFGDWENDPENASKVVDENGEPMVVWHGRSAEFNTFEKKEGVRFIMGLEDKVKADGFFFSPDKGLAEEFASNSSRHRGGKANVVPCFLNIRKPMDLTGEDYDRIYEDVTGWEYMVGMDTQDNLWGIMDEEGMADKIKEKGYDGAIFVEEVDDSYEPTKISYCALDANQIKSAENNNGDFSADNNDIRFSLAGERGAASADKAEERTIRMDNLSVARKMEEEKKDAKAIKMATGWERGADGKWRYEMPDAKIKDTMDVGGGHIVKRYEDDMLWNGGKLSKVIDAPELFKAYPQLKDVRIDTDAIMNDMPSNGEYNAKTNTITIHADELKYMNSILNHEIQHAIQSIEGFDRGGSPRLVRGEIKKRLAEVTKQIRQLRAEGKEGEAKAIVEKNRGLYNAYQANDDYNSYKSLAGEVEARNVQERMNMTPEERRKTLAESTEDVARKDQIFLGVGDVSFSLRDMADGKDNGAADMAEDLKSLITPGEVDDAIKIAIEDMPSGWKMANKKMIHIAQALGENRKAEIAGEEPKFSLKDGTLIKAGTYFSGGGLVEEGLKGIIDPVVAVEYDEKISGVYRNNFGQHIVTADVRDVDPKELVKQIDGEVEYFHASPVCKNYSQAKSNHAEVELDKETAASTAEFINAVKPKVVTIENVKGYKDSDAMKTITDALDANGYTWDADVYNAADYGGYTNRERLIVRAVRDGKLPAKPKKMAHKSGWYEAVADIIPTLTEKKNGVANWMDIRLKADGIDWRHIDKPLYVMGSAYADGKIPHAFADELLPTLRTKSGDVIVMPDGKVYRAMGRVLARVSGVSDDYKMPFSENLSHTIIGNGIPTQLTEHVIAPLLTGSDPKFSIRTYHGTGASFDKFDLSHALEGEGSESFGHGVYVTNSSKIGREYAQRAKNRKMENLYKNMRYPDGVKGDIFKRRVFGEMVNDVATGGSVASAKEFAKMRVGADANDIQRTLENLKDREKGTEYEQNLKDRLAEYKEALKWIDSLDEDYLTQGNANRYDVDIPDDNGSNYLDWEGTIPDSLDKQKVAEDAYKVVSDNQGFNDFKATPLNDSIAHTLKTYVYTTDVAGRVEKLKSDIKDVIENYVADDDVLALNEYLKDATPDDVLATIWYNDIVRDIKDADLGEDLYRKLSTYVGDNTASQILSDNGLVGIKYPAGMIHGGAKEGDYNYVIFDENNANIVGNTRFSLRYDQFEHDLNQWKKDNNLPKDAQRPTIPQRNAGESAAAFLKRVDEYRKQMALWKTAPTYEQHLLSDDTALGEFNRELQRGSVLKRIAFQDSMLAIRKAQEAIMKEVGVDRLNMAEDAYTAENRSHGKGKNEFEEYNNEFLQPLRKAYHQMKKVLGDSYDNVRVYMMAKHGLERDAQMAFKKSLEADYEDVNQRSAAYKAYKNDLDRVSNDADLEFGRVDFTTWRQKDNALRGKYSPSYMDYRYDDNGIAYDYSGLSSLFDGSDFEEAAHKLVKDIEDKYVTETHDLWDATNAATKKILRDGFKAGMMSKEAYEYVKGMYSHYIPLRGWDGTTADQVWDYIGGGNGAFNQTLKTAHGRTSIADDPIAYIENMAESGILLNNKNWVKQHLMLLAQNHPTSLLTLSKAWYVKSTDANGNEEWIPATPQITSQMNSNQVKAAIDAFEQKMEQMAQTGDATQQRDGLNIAYPQTHSEEREHEVRVMKDGEEYVIYVNGDPQLAQAMNNTRAHRVREIQSGKLDRAAAWLGRKMAAAYTSLSPLFIPSNYFRDLTMTLASTAIREDGRYNYLLRKNLATSWNLGFMLRDYQNGKLREKVSNGNATPKEQMFYDFMMNGGETGFVSSLDVEDLKKKFKNDLKDLDRWKANPVKVGHTIMDGIEFLNRAIEDSNRFAVYMTSIQYGRSIDEAVNDAKDVTLNFNRKGTGEYGWQMIRNLYLFINPAVQSLQTLGALVKHHPFKFTAVTAAWLASGVLVPIVNAALMSLLGGDDDKDKYWQFSKWDRRNNAIMWIPFTNEYVKIPLAQEFRAFYGIGDMIASKMMGGELAEETWSQYADDLLGQVVDMLPLDPTGYDGNIAVSLMPNAIRPVFELAFNVDFTGKPLFKDSEYNKYDPNFTKAYVGTPDWLVRVSKMVNSIGNDYPDVQQNAIDAFGDPRYNLNNPAVVDHVLSSYLGGAYTMGSQVLGLLTKSLNDPKEIKMADIPLVSKFVSNPDDRPVTKKQGDEFWNMKENHDRAANTLSKLKKQAKVDGDYTLLQQFYGSEEYKQYKQDDVKVKKYEEDKKKERAEESGEEYRPHKLNAEDIYKAHATPKDDFEDLKLKQLFTKLNGFKTSYDLLVDTAPGQSDGYYNTNKTAIDAIDEISLDKQEISELKKGFLEDGKDAYNAEDMKRIRELRKRILSVLEPANKVVVANQKAKSEKK